MVPSKGQGFSAADKARLLLRSNQSTAVLCSNPKPCRYGDKCKFAHNLEEARVYREVYGGSGTRGQEARAQGAPRWQEDKEPPYCPPYLYKTALCTWWKERGTCRFADLCNFAHGEHELRPQPRRFQPIHHVNTYRQDNSSMSIGSGGGNSSRVVEGYSTESVHTVEEHDGGTAERNRSNDVVTAGADEEVLAIAAAAAVPLSEAYAAQQQHEWAQQAQQGQGHATLGGGEDADGIPRWGGTPSAKQGTGRVEAPRIESSTEFPALPGAPAGSDGGGSKRGRTAEEAVADDGLPGFERRGSGSSGSRESSAPPPTVCYREDSPRRPSGSTAGSSRAGSVRSGSADLEAASWHSTPSMPPAASSPSEPSSPEGPRLLQRQDGGASGAWAHVVRAGGADRAAAEVAAEHEEPAVIEDHEESPEGDASQEGAPALPAQPDGTAAALTGQAPAAAAAPDAPSAVVPEAGAPPTAFVPAAASPAPPLPLPIAVSTAASQPAQASSGRPLPLAAPPGFSAPYKPTLAAAQAPPAPALPGAAPAGDPARAAFLQCVVPGGQVDLSLLPSFLCPITKQPFVNPVVAADGLTYEKAVITDWLYRQNKEVSPLTGQQLPHRLLLPNDAMRRAMDEVSELIRALAT